MEKPAYSIISFVVPFRKISKKEGDEVIFGAGKQISSLQERIRELEIEREQLSNQVLQAQAEMSHLEDENSLLRRKVHELETLCSEQKESYSELLVALDKEKKVVMKTQQEREAVHSELSGVLEANNELKQRVHTLSDRITAYESMTPEQFLDWGADHFSLEQLSFILEKAQSKAFIRVRTDQKKAYIQQIVNTLTCVNFPVSKEISLLRLLRTIDQESTVSSIEMEKRVISQPISKILVAHSDHYSRVRIIQNRQAVPKYCFEALTPNDYAKKTAICNLVDVLGQIVKKFSYQ